MEGSEFDVGEWGPPPRKLPSGHDEGWDIESDKWTTREDLAKYDLNNGIGGYIVPEGMELTLCGTNMGEFWDTCETISGPADAAVDELPYDMFMMGI